MDQKQWIIRALDGDRTARAHLFEGTISQVYYLCWKLTGSTAQAGDLTRRTFSRAFSHLDQLRPDANFDRWVTAIAINLCRQSLKKSQPWLFSTSEQEMIVLRDTYLADEECLPPECLTRPDMKEVALHAITLLPPEQRICMVLRYAAQLKPHQIAKTLDVDEITILGRLNSGRRALLTSIPSPTPKAIISDLFALEASSLPVPEMLRESCMQTVLTVQSDTHNEPEAPESTNVSAEDSDRGLFANMSKKQKYLLFGGGGAALLLIILILILALRGCSSSKPDKPELPEPNPAPVEEVDENLEAEALLKEYGIEVLLTFNRREAETLVDDWQSILPDYVSTGDINDLALDVHSTNDEISEVRLSLEKTDLDITRLRDLGLGVEPELSRSSAVIHETYHLPCYNDTPLFDPIARNSESIAAYSENYRYELIDTNADGRANLLSITRTGASFDTKNGCFRPYGNSLTDLIGMDRNTAAPLLGDGDYTDDNADYYAMSVNGQAADGSFVKISAIMEARNEMDAARQNISSITLDVNGCFAELLPELQLPDSALTLTQLERKLGALDGHIGLLDGDIFAPSKIDSNGIFLAYYDDSSRYLFASDGQDSYVNLVEILDISDCRLWDSKTLSFKQDGPDLEALLGLDKYQAYSEYGIRSYPTRNLNSTALGLWESNGTIRTIFNSADPRALWGLKLGASRESIESKIESSNGYCCAKDESSARYVLSGKKELSVTYSDGNAVTLQLEDHSYQSDYTAPEPIKKSDEELFTEFLDTFQDVRSSWCGDLTHDGNHELLICRPSGSGCLLQLYKTGNNEVIATPLYTLSIASSDYTSIYLVNHDSGPCLLQYKLNESVTSYDCRWKLFSINAAGGEVVLGQNEASVNLLDILLEGQENYESVKKEAAGLAAKGEFLCGTQEGKANFSDSKADLD